MFYIKRLYTFMLQRFMPLFVMTFFICLFIVMMQFLYRYSSDIIGKGLGAGVIAELFWYASLTMVPRALPLAVLLASLMTFGNLGERFELTALKASGISLIRIMSPLIVLMLMVAAGAFFFQNDILPLAQTKMYTLLFSMRQKSPEKEIPVKTFYGEIPQVNLYVERKDPFTGTLYDIILYDISAGLDNSRIILADSGQLAFTADKTHIHLRLWQGEQFENLRDGSLGVNALQNMPFRRETFADKEVYVPFDANFNRIDENIMRQQYIGKNIAELRRSIDSIGRVVDSIGTRYGRDILTTTYVDVPYGRMQMVGGRDTLVKTPEVRLSKPLDVDRVFAGRSPTMARTYLQQAQAKLKRHRSEYEFKALMLDDQDALVRRHDIELQKKFTLSIACLIFFFIGAPLGAIIKKGGIGTPLVISVLLFIVYWIVDDGGYKLARDGRIPVWEGMWLSTFVLAPLGIFFTYKAVGDSAVFNMDAYRAFLRRLTGRYPKRDLEPKEFFVTEMDASRAVERVHAALASIASMQALLGHYPAVLRPLLALTVPTLRRAMAALRIQLDSDIEYLSNARDPRVVAFLNQIPYRVSPRTLSRVADELHSILTLITPKDQENDTGTP